jgi:PIN domain nuclease of toxin-antitoxin system
VVRRRQPSALENGERSISEKAEQVWLSHASVWELTIKRTVSRLELPEDPGQMARRAGMRLLPIELSHIRSTAALPRHHGDPFDRMLVGQAIEEGLVLVTGDATVQRYPFAWLW